MHGRSASGKHGATSRQLARPQLQQRCGQRSRAYLHADGLPYCHCFWRDDGLAVDWEGGNKGLQSLLLGGVACRLQFLEEQGQRQGTKAWCCAQAVPVRDQARFDLAQAPYVGVGGSKRLDLTGETLVIAR